jgi:hypothetical protein
MRRRVSRGAPKRTNGAAFWIILRDATLSHGPQDEVGWSANADSVTEDTR